VLLSRIILNGYPQFLPVPHNPNSHWLSHAGDSIPTIIHLHHSTTPSSLHLKSLFLKKIRKSCFASYSLNCSKSSEVVPSFSCQHIHSSGVKNFDSGSFPTEIKIPPKLRWSHLRFHVLLTLTSKKPIRGSRLARNILEKVMESILWWWQDFQREPFPILQRAQHSWIISRLKHGRKNLKSSPS